MLIGSIEAGGTKFVCAVGNENYQVQDQVSIPTTTPDETIKAVIAYFKQFELDAMGIASFGPIEIRKNNPLYGYITTTPKPNWHNTDLLGQIKAAFDVPTTWTTDVNGSAYGEYVMSTLSNEKIQSLVYYTVGTGVGAGAVMDDHFLGGIGHPEMGHTFVKRHPADLDFKGICPYHADCLEGLVAGPTFEARLGQKGETVPLTDPVWDILAYYLAQAVIQATLIVRPAKIVFGGSVINDMLLAKVRQSVTEQLNGYVELPPLDQYITRPAIANNGSATLGNFALGLKELQS
ncbi:fructokinase ScrK [Latilactobacillus fuchuensis]|uniref:Fructokinase n=1 Tax=Latilactobacillus fuchuensis DSM 14340 = JCM 11249 TaxID=1423747 RepID=A0A0R1RUW2_9LACO|nr:fructokinase ScrK [Latilactobacillus fuchuensis]KRL60919.1 fructokinase branched chain amino acid 2-keto-4-methylthiobutyrate aminotransferase [Latilactobacillus fuchuensis DSM 14340 = JCM 11249]